MFKKKISKNRTVSIKGSSIAEGATIINSSVADGAKMEGTTVAKNANIIKSSIANKSEMLETEIAKGANIYRSKIANNSTVKDRLIKTLSIKNKYAIIVLSISVIIILILSLLETGWSITPIIITISGLSGLWAFLNLLLNIFKYLLNDS